MDSVSAQRRDTHTHPDSGKCRRIVGCLCVSVEWNRLCVQHARTGNNEKEQQTFNSRCVFNDKSFVAGGGGWRRRRLASAQRAARPAHKSQLRNDSEIDLWRTDASARGFVRWIPLTNLSENTIEQHIILGAERTVFVLSNYERQCGRSRGCNTPAGMIHVCVCVRAHRRDLTSEARAATQCPVVV